VKERNSLHILTRLSARENFNEFCRRESSVRMPIAFHVTWQIISTKIIRYQFNILEGRGAKIFLKSMSHFKFLDPRKVKWGKFHTEDPQILGTTVPNLVATATWDPRFVHTYCKFRNVCIGLLLTLRRLMSYIYGAPILDVSRSHTTTQHSR